MLVNQPKLTTGKQPVVSRGKGNPMTDHARQVPGSTRSRRTPFSRSATPPWRPQDLGKSTYKTQTKFRQNRKCNLFSIYPSTTCNFNAVKCLNLWATAWFPLSQGEGQGEGQTGSSFSGGSRHHPFSLGKKVGMRDKPVHSGLWRPVATYFTYTVQNRRNRRVRRFSTNPTTRYQVLTHTKIGVRRFFRRLILCASLRSLRPSLRVPLETGKNRNFPEFRFPDPRPRFATLGLGSSSFICHSSFGNSSLVLRLRVFALK